MSKRQALLDTGPLVVLVVGSVDAGLLGSTQHLKAYLPEDWLILQRFLSGYGTVAITPHVATEAAHFSSKISDQRGKHVKARLIEVLAAIEERAVASKTAAARREFAWLDLADCSLLEAGGPQDTLLSTDAVLVSRRLALGLSAVNFNHLREQAGIV